MTPLRKIVLLCFVLILAGGCTSTSVSTGGLEAKNLKFSGSQDAKDERSDSKFKKGEKVFVLFDIEGFKQADDDNVWVQEDLDVAGPDGKSIMKRENLLELHQKAPKGTNTMNAHNDITLPDAAGPGEYKVTISLRDKVGGGTSTNTTTFTVE